MIRAIVSHTKDLEPATRPRVGRLVRQGGAQVAAAAAAVSLACCAIIGPACALPSSRADITLRDIVDRPQTVMGRHASVDGTVSSVVSPHLFIMRGTGDLHSFTIPVVSEVAVAALPGRSATESVRVNDRVYVSGDVLHFSRDAVESRIDGRVSDALNNRYADLPMIVADDVSIDTPPARSSASFHRRRSVPDVTYLIMRSRLADLTGQEVRLSRVRVLDVISDRGFWIGTSADRRMFAVLDPALDNGAMENLVRIRKGQILNLTGVVEKMPDRSEALHRWTIQPREADELIRQPVYLHVIGVSELVR